MATVRLDCTGAEVRDRTPDTNYKNPSSVTYGLIPDTGLVALLLRFSGLPAEYQYRQQTAQKIYVKGYSTPNKYFPNTNWSFSHGTARAFDPATATWNNASFNTGNYSKDFEAETWGNDNVDVYKYIGIGYFYYAIEPALPDDPVDAVTVYGPGNSSKKPYILITLADSDATTTPTPTTYPQDWVDKTKAQTFAWKLTPSAEVPGTFSQTDSQFEWRVKGQTEWNTVKGGAALSITVPAGTFPGASTIEWRIASTNNLNYTGYSTVREISTVAAKTTVTLTYPINDAAIDETVANTFRWTTRNIHGTDQTRAQLAYRVQDTEDWTHIDIPGNTKEYTFPAGTFPAAKYSWGVRAYNEDDVAGDWGMGSFTTIDTPAVATPTAPVGSVEDGSAPIIYRWAISNPSGSRPTGSDLQISRDGATWGDSIHFDGTTSTYTVPADTYTAGDVYWRVRAYNRNNTAGAWSAAATFVVVAAPLAPSVTVTPVPFATISWQVEGQQAYKIAVDGTVYGPFYGTVKTWTSPDYLSDGEHTITVEVQGMYGLWSQPGSVTFAVKNAAGPGIILSGDFDRDAVLVWEPEDGKGDYLVYRDGVQIGHTAKNTFTDRLALGTHSYRVIGRLTDGNYSLSNAVSGTMCSCCMAIAPLSGGEWMELPLSENSAREEAFSWAKTVSLRHFHGAVYPVAEISPFADESASYDVSFVDSKQVEAFDRLRGRAVILKSRGDNVMIGILSFVSKRHTEFYTAFGFTLNRMHWRDFIDDADG